ncbi:hypothetical protein K7432_014392 [Basidiobolus ranarum]|uniref:FAR1 domain-containing protein n=1 Tax=Basidiobolus ranarum TaxID=34480 RepID=A0ABR2WHP4_9FUNG
MQFISPKEGFDYCQQLARSCGFGIRRRTSKDSTIYIVCSKEGKSEYKGTTFRVRNRVSERCNCDWRVVLFLSKRKLWEFKAGKCMVHNHPLTQRNEYSRKRTKIEESLPRHDDSVHKMVDSIPSSPSYHRTPPPSPPEVDSHNIPSIAPNRGSHHFLEYTRSPGCISGRSFYPNPSLQTNFRQLLPSSGRFCQHPRYPLPSNNLNCAQHNSETTQTSEENADLSQNDMNPCKDVQKAALQFILN